MRWWWMSVWIVAGCTGTPNYDVDPAHPLVEGFYEVDESDTSTDTCGAAGGVISSGFDGEITWDGDDLVFIPDGDQFNNTSLELTADGSGGFVGQYVAGISLDQMAAGCLVPLTVVSEAVIVDPATLRMSNVASADPGGPECDSLGGLVSLPCTVVYTQVLVLE